MSSNSDKTTSLAEDKVLILYILNLIDGDIIEDGLFKIISSINDINYFYFKQVLTDLIDSKLVGTYTKEEEQVIKITSEGKNAYQLTKDVLPGIMKLKADNIFAKEFSSIALKRYLLDKWVDGLALLISILAFIGAYRHEINAVLQILKQVLTK